MHGPSSLGSYSSQKYAAYNSYALSYDVANSSSNRIVVTTSDGESICSNAQCEVSRDVIARGLYGTVTQIYGYFKRVFGLEGIDGKGGIVPLKIHWNQENAQWGCIGKDCAWTFNDLFAAHEDIVAHEYTHGIISCLNPLASSGQAGALNESCADVLGLLFKNRREIALGKKIADIDWTVGRGLIDRNISVHLDMQSFKKVSQPTKENDYGYVHDNSKIPSHAFFQAVWEMDGATKKYNCLKIAQIWFQSMQKMNYNETFAGFAQKTIETAIQLRDQLAVEALQNAWVHVGVLKFL